MGLGDAFRSWWLSREVRRLLIAGKRKNALALVSSAGEQLRASALVDLARDCDEDESELACELLQQALVRSPQHDDAMWLLAQLEARTGRLRSSIDRLRELRARFPHRVDVLAKLADVLIALEHATEAEALLAGWEESTEVRLLCLLGKARFAQGRLREALPPLDRATELYEQLVRADPLSYGQSLRDDEYAELEALHSEVLAAVHGHETLVMEAARRRKLDPRAGVNFMLLAAHLMVDAPCRAPSLDLLPLDRLRALAEELTRNEESVGLVQRGMVALREGRFREALKHFERAHELSPKDFAPLLGKGAALELDQQDVLGALKHLPDVGPLEGLERVFPEWPALTERERRVVHASVLPLRQFLPRLAQRGYRVRILPLDVRTVDVPELAHVQDEPGEGEYRAFETLHGVAVGNIAAAKVEGLLSLAPGANGWVLAHEFAHLVLIAGPGQLRSRVQRLHRRAERVGYVGSEYQKKNEDEFFACAYTEYLARRYGLDAEQQLDDWGVAADVLALFEELDGDAPA